MTNSWPTPEGEPAAPGCFGSGLAFHAEQPECVACTFGARCAPLASASLALIRVKYGSKTLIAQPPKPPAPPAPPSSAPTLTYAAPDQVKSVMESLDRSGIRVTENLRHRRIHKKMPAPLALICKLLIACENKSVLTMSLVERMMISRLEKTPRQARQWTVLLVQVLVNLGAVEENNGILTIKA